MMFKFASSSLRRFPRLTLGLAWSFALPKHDVLTMPALSPTMTEGKILKWYIKEGDKVAPGDSIAEIQTDKATMPFEVQEKGYIAKINSNTDAIAIGAPVAVVIKKQDQVAQFQKFDFNATGEQSEPKENSSETTTQKSKPKQTSKSTKEYPAHTFLQYFYYDKRMPAVSPTMTEGKVLNWKIKPGDSFTVGDALFSLETDKATVDYQATQKGVLAKVIAKSDQLLPIGQNLAVVVKKKDLVSQFSDFEEGSGQKEAQPEVQDKKQASKDSTPSSTSATSSQQSGSSSNEKLIVSPLAKVFAKQKNVDLSKVQGSGPGGRIIKQDIENYLQKPPPAPKAAKQQTKHEEKPAVVASKQQASEPTPQKKESQPQQPQRTFTPSQNPYEQISLTSMRKTIANRLQESKQTIPHYYITLSVEMDAVNSLRTELNANQKQNEVKISINDIIVKAMALALRDYPDVNVQWHGTSIRRFKHSDISIAVAIDGGLITPIIHRAQTLGLIEISKRTKDLAKRARQGKLQPSEFVGGTSTISNLGMYNINTVSSIINPPQASILGVGKTQKRVLPGQGPQQIRFAQVMDVISSCDHRAVDGALCAQWVNRIKYYLEHPAHMLL